jgi:hypothetical protein
VAYQQSSFYVCNIAHRVASRWQRIRWPSNNGGRVNNRRHPSRTILIGDLCAELGGYIRIIELDLLFVDAIVPRGVKVHLAKPGYCDQVPAVIIVEGHVQRLMNIANPVTEAFE